MNTKPDKSTEKPSNSISLNSERYEISECLQRIDGEIERFFQIYGGDLSVEDDSQEQSRKG
jgi:hypothetical protein